MPTESEHATPPSALALVPARLASTRLERKMLLRETGRFLFQHTVENLRASGVFGDVLLATDHEEIVRAAGTVDIEALLTRADHTSGTDRVFEAHEQLLARKAGPWDVIVNVQGDEPDLAAADLRALVAAFADPAVELATLARPIETQAEFNDAACVKVVRDHAGDALYFSRAAIPSSAHPAGPASGTAHKYASRHVGVYAFRPSALALFTQLTHAELEQVESLEQLRWLHHGHKLRIVDAQHSAMGIDTPEDYRRFVRSQNLS